MPLCATAALPAEPLRSQGMEIRDSPNSDILGHLRIIHTKMATQIDVGRPLDVGRVRLALRPWRRWLLVRSADLRLDTDLLVWALVPALTFVVMAWVTVIWLALDRAPLFYDPVDHVSLAIDFVNSPVEYLSREHMWYPPFVHVLLGSALAATGYDLDSAIAMVNLAFFAVLLAATFAIGAELWSPRVGAG